MKSEGFGVPPEQLVLRGKSIYVLRRFRNTPIVAAKMPREHVVLCGSFGGPRATFEKLRTPGFDASNRWFAFFLC